MADAAAAEGATILPGWLRRALGQLPLQARAKEPLAASAPLALDWAESHCQGCRAYHGLWQYRRLIGGVVALDADGPIYQAVLAALAREEGLRRVLIAAAADYAVQAIVRDAFRGIGEEESAAQITVVDRCATPLLVNAWLAQRRGGSIVTRQGNLLDVALGDRYDIVLSHSLFHWFSPQERCRLTERWFEALRPGGRVLLSNRVRPFNEQGLPDTESLSAALVRELEGASDRLPADALPRLLALAPEMHRKNEHHLARSIDEVTRPFEAAGFEIEAVMVAEDLLPGMQDRDTFFGLRLAEAKRHLVLARRPH
jgi:SAM-dependent methyltransferase